MSSSSAANSVRQRSAALRWLAVALLGCLVATAVALWQPVGPITTTVPVTSPAKSWSAWWLEPVERNPHRRLPGVGAELSGVDFSADGQRGWAVGWDGTVIATQDGGRTWVPQTSGTTQALRAVHVSVDGQRGWAVGDNGIVIATQNGGQTWGPQASGTTQNLRALHFSADGQRGWAVGDQGTVIATQNGGQTWVPQTSGTTQNLRALHVSADGQRGRAVGEEGIVIATQDGGRTWVPQIWRTTKGLWALHVSAGGQRVWAVGEEGVVIATQDGARTWAPQTSGTTQDLRALHVSADGQRGWAVGEGGTVIATQDGGRTWAPQTSGTAQKLWALHVSADGRRGWAVGEGGTVIATQDGGRTWAPQTSGTTPVLLALHVGADGQHGWAVDRNGTVIATQDGGRSWAQQTSGTMQVLGALHVSVDGLRGWAVGAGGTVIATQDGGQTWAAQTSGTTQDLRALHVSADGLRGWAVGWDGTVIATQNGGRTWAPQTSGTTQNLRAVQISADGRRGWAVGDNGTVIATQDGGQTWARQKLGMTLALFAVHVSADGQRGWAVGDRGAVIVTQDGGQTWARQTSGTKQGFWALQVSADGRRGWAVGDSGTVITTQNGGQTWAPQTSGTTQGLTALQVSADGQHGWAVGDQGTLIATQDGGQTWADPRPYRRYPAPWYWLALLLTLPALGVAWRHWTAAGRATSGMADMAATDAALTRPEQDRLNFGPLASGISRFLRNRATEPPLTLAITGDWGSGKSSLMGLLCADLRRHGLRPVWFNAWHHQKEEHLFAALLGALSTEAPPPWLSPDGLNFRLRLLWGRSRKHWLFSIALCVAVAAGVTLHLGMADTGAETRLLKRLGSSFASWAEPAKPTVAASAAPAATATPTPAEPDSSWARWLALLAVASTTAAALRKALTAFGADPAALLAGSLNGMKLSHAAEQNSFRTRFAQQFAEVTEALPERLVIVIDDLDRCRPEAVLDTMEAVNFLTSSGRCFVIFGMATDKVQAALAIAFERIAKELAEDDPAMADKEVAARRQRRAYAANYLHKLINLEIKVPTTQDFEAWRLLSDDPAQPAAPAWWRQFMAGVRRHWMWGSMAAALAAGTVAGKALLPAEQQAAPPVLAAVPAPLIPASAASLPASIASSLNEIPRQREAAAPGAPLVQPGQTSRADRWLILGALFLGATLAGLLVLRVAMRRHREATDSQEFREALKVWTELVRAHAGTPRAVKRFGNKLRYFEMLQQGQERDLSWFDEWRASWLAWRGRGAAGKSSEPGQPAAQPGSPARRLATPQLVALGALYETFGHEWLKRLQRDVSADPADGPAQLAAGHQDDGLAGTEHGETALALIRKHRQQFNTVWPPSEEEVEVFARLLAGVRMPGDVEEVAMRRGADHSEGMLGGKVELDAARAEERISSDSAGDTK